MAHTNEERLEILTELQREEVLTNGSAVRIAYLEREIEIAKEYILTGEERKLNV